MTIASLRLFIKNHKKWVILGLVVLLLVVVIVSLPKAKPAEDIKVYPREGFSQLPGSIADPEALVADGREKPVAFGGSPVIHACNLLPLDQLKHNQLHLFPNSGNSTYERTYISSDGRGPLPKYGIALGNDINKCDYTFSDRHNISMSVWQPSYLDASYIKYDLPGYSTAESPDPTVTHRVQNKVGGTISHLLQKGDTYAEFNFLSVMSRDTAALDALINKLTPQIIKNFSAQVDRPSGIPTYKYDSPTFTESVARSCSLINADSFQKALKAQPSLAVKEKINSAVGLISGFKDTGDDYFHYLNSECERTTGDSSYRSEQKRFTINVKSYENPAGAKGEFDFGRVSDKGAATPRTYGDASYAVTTSYKADPGTVMIRKGRFLLKLTIVDPSHESSKTDPMYFVQQLDPAISDILSRLPH